MGAAVILFAAVPAWLLAGLALLLGAGWGLAALVLVGSGMSLALALALAVAARPAHRAPDHAPAGMAPPEGGQGLPQA